MTVFDEVVGALLNSDCDPFEASAQALCALYAFCALELEGSELDVRLEHLVTKMNLGDRLPLEDPYGELRKQLAEAWLQKNCARKKKK